MQSTKGGTYSPWWNPDCEREYRRRKAAWRKLLYNQCPRNWNDYKFVATTFRQTVDQAKENYNTKHYSYLSQSSNKKALFRFLRSKKIVSAPINVESVSLTSTELVQSLEEIAKGLERRFTSLRPYHIPAPETANDYIAVT